MDELSYSVMLVQDFADSTGIALVSMKRGHHGCLGLFQAHLNAH